MLGWKLEELRGRKMHDMTHYKYPDGRPYPAEECAGFQVLKSGQAVTNHDDVFIRKDGTFLDVVYSSAPLKSSDAIVGLVVVFRDVSERKRAEGAIGAAAGVWSYDRLLAVGPERRARFLRRARVRRAGVQNGRAVATRH